MIDQQTLKYFLRYDPETGIFRWNIPNGRNGKNSIAGTIRTSYGYRKIRLKAKNYRASRLAYLYMTGRWPEPTVDHINRIRDDDRWSNLREATHSENNRNKAPYGRVPYKGVSLQRKSYIASIWSQGIQKYLGSFKTAEQAAQAYIAAAKKSPEGL